MVIHPDLVLDHAHHRQSELIAEADRQRLLALVRRNRRRNAAASAAPRGRPDTVCEPQPTRVAAPVR